MADSPVNFTENLAVKLGLKNEERFIMYLKEGMSLTATCDLTDNDIKELSTLVKGKSKRGKVMLEEFNNIIDSSAADRLNRYTIMLLKTSPTKAEFSLMEFLRSQLVNKRSLVFWEDFCTRAALKPTVITDALIYYRDFKDAATGCGLTRLEYITYIREHEEIKEYLYENGVRMQIL